MHKWLRVYIYLGLPEELEVRGLLCGAAAPRKVVRGDGGGLTRPTLVLRVACVTGGRAEAGAQAMDAGAGWAGAPRTPAVAGRGAARRSSKGGYRTACKVEVTHGTHMQHQSTQAA